MEKQNNYLFTIDNNNREDVIIEDSGSIQKDIEARDDSHSNKGKQTFFHEEYSKADHFIAKRLKLQKSTGEESKPPYKCLNFAQAKERRSIGNRNNIIVFTGERGSGKTSAMKSFGRFLQQNYPIDSFKLLDMIDPSYFRNNNSILLNIITIMFKMAKEQNKSYSTNSDVQNNKKGTYNDLLMDFVKAFSAVKRMESEIPKDDSIEHLNELSDTIDMQDLLRNLIDKFLRFDENNPNYLVIMIDDLDMNVSVAATMLEQIRKFLIHENVIILFATNMDQLQYEMKEYYSKNYEKIIGTQGQTTYFNVDVDEMATKYLLKLFPPSQRIHLGESANKLVNAELLIKNLGEDGKEEKEMRGDLQTTILSLIWKKTRLIFLPESNQLHPIITTNLRALHQFIFLLLDLKDIPLDKTSEKGACIFGNTYSGYTIARDNFYKFKDFTLNILIPSSLNSEEQKVFDNIPKDIKRINKHLIQSINVFGNNYKKSLLVKEINEEGYINERGEQKRFDSDIYTFVSPNDPKFSNANKISDILNFPSNNSMGDILLLIDKYKTYFEAVSQNFFIEAIKIYYSLLLFETMYFDVSSHNFKKMDSTNISNLQRLIGGTIYFPHYFKIIQSNSYERLKETAIENIKKNRLDNNSNTTAEREILEKEPDIHSSKRTEVILGYHLYYNIAEYMHGKTNPFLIQYYGNKRPERAYSKHIYDTTKSDSLLRDADMDEVLKYEEGKKYYRFDILSLLINVLNPYQTLARFTDENENENENEKKTTRGHIDKWIAYNILKDKKREVNIDTQSGNIYFQNSILPIYSIDLVLLFLRNTIDFDRIQTNKESSTQLSDNAKIDCILNELKKMELDGRDQEAIKKYYNEIFTKLKDKMRQVFIKDCDKIINIYDNIYKKGISCFLDNITTS